MQHLLELMQNRGFHSVYFCFLIESQFILHKTCDAIH